MALDGKYLRGLDDALRSMHRLRDDTAPALVNALNKGVEEVADRARVLAPKRSGDLRKSIKTEFVASPRRLRARVFTDLFYARFVEFGTVEQPAQPFFYPAVRSLQKRVTRRVTRALKAAARKVANGRR